MRRLIWGFAGRTYHIIGNLMHWLISIAKVDSFALRGCIFQKLLLAWIFSCLNKNCFFIKETDTFGHIVVWTIYTSHIDHFTPQHTTFEQSTTCFSVFLELLPGFIPFAMLWHAGWTLEKNICIEHELQLSDYNMGKYFRPNVQISGKTIYFFHSCL